MAMLPEDAAERLAREMVRDAIRPIRNYRPPDAGAVAKLRGEVVRARREGRQGALAAVADAWRLYTETDDIDAFRDTLTELMEDAGLLPKGGRHAG